MDKTDHKILKILQLNAKTTIKQISQEVNLSAPSVTERIRRLEESGVILGYHAQVNPAKLSKSLTVFIAVDVVPGKYTAFSSFCSTCPQILEHHRVVGVHNAMLLAVLRESSELESLIDHLKKYGTTSTSIILSTIFENKPIDTDGIS